MTAQNRPVSRPTSKSYRDNWDRIFNSDTGDIWDKEEFYNLMQAYRFNEGDVVKAFEAVKEYIRKN